METARIHGLQVRYADVGDGVPVLIAHCSSASHKQWSALTAVLADRYRVVTPDLIGYGESDPWPAGTAFVPSADADVLVALAEQVGGRLHLAGHSYGAAMALEAARLLGERVISLSLIEPVSFHLLTPAGREPEWREVTAVSHGIQQGVRAGRPSRAAAVYMGFWIGRLRWWLMPRRLRAGIIATVGKVAHEFGAIERATVRLDDYTGIRTPTRLIVGERTRRPARAVIEVLADLLPRVDVTEIPRAGHMSPFTHRDVVNHLLASHIDQNPG